MTPTKTAWRRLLAISAVLLCACDTAAESLGPPQATAVGNSVAMTIWAPARNDTCTREIHDRYRTIGPDGLNYPTWHPPVDPVTGCLFGHEHGRDPAESDLFVEVGAIPFGYANEHLVASGFGATRNEDHVGHKIEWENGIAMRVGQGAGAVISIRCDVLTKLHQGTHSPDAFTNNLHELAYHIRCSDGTGFSATVLTPIGSPGELVVGCNRGQHVEAGTASPSISPRGGGQRAIPAAGCIDNFVLRGDGQRPRFNAALHESWEVSVTLKRLEGGPLLGINPYFQVMDPSRYFAPFLERALGRPVDLCTRAGIAGRDRCEGVPATGVAWDDPRSPFKGVRRFVDINSNHVRNADGPNLWYTDPFGRNGRTEPFPGSIRQWVAKRDNTGLDLHGPTIGRDRGYDGPGVHAPN